MPLSEEEQRLLEQMEEALATEDPKFVSALRGVSSRARAKRIVVLATVGFLAGIALLMAGVIYVQTLVAVGGFVVMLASAYIALTNVRRLREPDLPDNVVPMRNSGSGAKARGNTAVPRSSGGFMNRMEDRWRRRRDDY